ncbi:hypothetical protein SNEBB_007281 [Seison nebaliae]|nr:hypothetical protein SNEBB_007281 [Seison nebaliae]
MEKVETIVLQHKNTQTSSIKDKNEHEIMFENLILDKVFVDYFNIYLSLPIFAQRLLFDYAKKKWTFDPPLSLKFLENFEEDFREWIVDFRFVPFLTSDIYGEYCFYKELTKAPIVLSVDLVVPVNDNISSDMRPAQTTPFTLEGLLGSVWLMRKLQNFFNDSMANTLWSFWFDVQYIRVREQTVPRKDLSEDFRHIHLHYISRSAFADNFLSQWPVLLEEVPAQKDIPLLFDNLSRLYQLQEKAMQLIRSYWLPKYLWRIYLILRRKDVSEKQEYLYSLHTYQKYEIPPSIFHVKAIQEEVDRRIARQSMTPISVISGMDTTKNLKNLKLKVSTTFAEIVGNHNKTNMLNYKGHQTAWFPGETVPVLPKLTKISNLKAARGILRIESAVPNIHQNDSLPSPAPGYEEREEEFLSQMGLKKEKLSTTSSSNPSNERSYLENSDMRNLNSKGLPAGLIIPYIPSTISLLNEDEPTTEQTSKYFDDFQGPFFNGTFGLQVNTMSSLGTLPLVIYAKYNRPNIHQSCFVDSLVGQPFRRWLIARERLDKLVYLDMILDLERYISMWTLDPERTFTLRKRRANRIIATYLCNRENAELKFNRITLNNLKDELITMKHVEKCKKMSSLCAKFLTADWVDYIIWDMKNFSLQNKNQHLAMARQDNKQEKTMKECDVRLERIEMILPKHLPPLDDIPQNKGVICNLGGLHVLQKELTTMPLFSKFCKMVDDGDNSKISPKTPNEEDAPKLHIKLLKDYFENIQIIKLENFDQEKTLSENVNEIHLLDAFSLPINLKLYKLNEEEKKFYFRKIQLDIPTDVLELLIEKKKLSKEKKKVEEKTDEEKVKEEDGDGEEGDVTQIKERIEKDLDEKIKVFANTANVKGNIIGTIYPKMYSVEEYAMMRNRQNEEIRSSEIVAGNEYLLPEELELKDGLVTIEFESSMTNSYIVPFVRVNFKNELIDLRNNKPITSLTFHLTPEGDLGAELLNYRIKRGWDRVSNYLLYQRPEENTVNSMIMQNVKSEEEAIDELDSLFKTALFEASDSKFPKMYFSLLTNIGENIMIGYVRQVESNRDNQTVIIYGKPSHIYETNIVLNVMNITALLNNENLFEDTTPWLEIPAEISKLVLSTLSSRHMISLTLTKIRFKIFKDKLNSFGGSRTNPKEVIDLVEIEAIIGTSSQLESIAPIAVFFDDIAKPFDDEKKVKTIIPIFAKGIFKFQHVETVEIPPMDNGEQLTKSMTKLMNLMAEEDLPQTVIFDKGDKRYENELITSPVVLMVVQFSDIPSKYRCFIKEFQLFENGMFALICSLPTEENIVSQMKRIPYNIDMLNVGNEKIFTGVILVVIPDISDRLGRSTLKFIGKLLTNDEAHMTKKDMSDVKGEEVYDFVKNYVSNEQRQEYNKQYGILKSNTDLKGKDHHLPCLVEDDDAHVLDLLKEPFQTRNIGIETTPLKKDFNERVKARLKNLKITKKNQFPTSQYIGRNSERMKWATYLTLQISRLDTRMVVEEDELKLDPEPDVARSADKEMGDMSPTLGDKKTLSLGKKSKSKARTSGSKTVSLVNRL